MNILHSPSWLGEPWRVERFRFWLDYYLRLRDRLGFDRIVMVDDASDLAVLGQFDINIYDEDWNPLKASEGIVHVIWCAEFLPRRGMCDYPYYWRDVKIMQSVLQEWDVEKMLWVETDMFVLTPRLADYLKGLDSGWTTFHSRMLNFPETALHVLCKDAMHRFLDFPIPSYDHYRGHLLENLWAPLFTHISRDFVGDRYGQENRRQEVHMDYYGQWVPPTRLVFDMRNDRIQHRRPRTADGATCVRRRLVKTSAGRILSVPSAR